MRTPKVRPDATRLPVSAVVLDRIFGRVERTPKGCWLWTGSKNSDGYPTIKVDGRVVLVTRLLLAASVRRFKKGELACHGCDTPLCIRPHRKHVRHGTHSSNTREMWARKRRSRPCTFVEGT